MGCICQDCKRKYHYRRSAGDTKSRCNSCQTRRKRLRQKQSAVKYLGGKCVKCGYNRSLAALHFHHRDRKSKLFAVGKAYNHSWTRIFAELDKCDLLCANCHHELEYGIVSPEAQDCVSGRCSGSYKVAT